MTKFLVRGVLISLTGLILSACQSAQMVDLVRIKQAEKIR